MRAHRRALAREGLAGPAALASLEAALRDEQVTYHWRVLRGSLATGRRACRRVAAASRRRALLGPFMFFRFGFGHH